MTYDRDAFTNYKSIPNTIVDLGADSRAKIVGQGNVVLRVVVKGKSIKCTIKNGKHAPTLRYQLLSVITMGRLAVRTSFDDEGAVLKNKASGKVMAFGRVVNNLYALNIDKELKHPNKALFANLDLWHQRLAHVNVAGIKKMLTKVIPTNNGR